MKAELRAVLDKAGWAHAEDDGAWARAVVLNNWGAVPRVPGVNDQFAQKGFKLLLLGESGRPEHFARCADVSDALMEGECRVSCVLSGSPELAHIIPQSRSASSENVRVLVSTFVGGTRFDRLERRQRPAEWARSIERVLAAAETAGRVAYHVLPELSEGRTPTVLLSQEAEADLVTLGEAGLPSSALQALESRFLATPPMPRLLQHGDLWSKNVLVENDSCWLIDFAEFGHVQVPLYDVCHMLAHSDRANFQVTPSASKSTWTMLSQEIVRRQAARVGSPGTSRGCRATTPLPASRRASPTISTG